MCLCLLLQRSGYQDSVLPHSGQARLHPIRAPSPFLIKQAHQHKLFLYENWRLLYRTWVVSVDSCESLLLRFDFLAGLMLSLANGMTPFSLLCLALRMRLFLLGDFEPHIHTTFPPMYYWIKDKPTVGISPRVVGRGSTFPLPYGTLDHTLFW